MVFQSLPPPLNFTFTARCCLGEIEQRQYKEGCRRILRVRCRTFALLLHQQLVRDIARHHSVQEVRVDSNFPNAPICLAILHSFSWQVHPASKVDCVCGHSFLWSKGFDLNRCTLQLRSAIVSLKICSSCSISLWFSLDNRRLLRFEIVIFGYQCSSPRVGLPRRPSSTNRPVAPLPPSRTRYELGFFDLRSKLAASWLGLRRECRRSHETAPWSNNSVLWEDILAWRHPPRGVIIRKNVRNPNHHDFSKKYRNTPLICIALRLQFVLQ